MRFPSGFLKQRARLILVAACGAVLVRWLLFAPPPPRTLAGLADILGASAHGVVRTEDIQWQPSPGFLTEALVGRPVLFLAAPKPGAPRDLYRAWVRVSLDGKPISVGHAYNLTRTSLGDDAGLQLVAGRAAIATTAFGRIQGISVFETQGARAEDRPHGWFARWLWAITARLGTGAWSGLGRNDLLFDVAPQTVDLSLSETELLVAVGDAQRDLVVDLDRRTVRGRDGGEPYATRLVTHQERGKAFVLWAVDLARSLVGPEPIAWLEREVFGVRDAVKRTAFGIVARGDETRLKENPDSLRPRSLPAGGQEGEEWPPAPIPSPWKQPKPGEGEWRPVDYPWLPKLPTRAGETPPYFYQTFIRPDPDRPYSEVHLVAMDMRQLELAMEGGYEDPEPLVGPPGTGRIPKDPAITRRVAATFNGAFKTTHGEYGMMVDRRVLVPPAPGAATVVTTHDGRAGFGNWPLGSKALPGDVRSFRQNLDPLVEDGVPNPSGRRVWGWQLAGQGVLTERTALCLSTDRQIYYAWGQEIDGPRFARALAMAGCDYAIHLDMNPKHCGFVFTRIEDVDRHEMQLALAHPAMGIRPNKFVLWSEKDFFYMLVREGTQVGQLRWAPSPAAQPSPRWQAAIFQTKTEVGALTVRLVRFERGRFDWLVRAGSAEPPAVGKHPKKTKLGAQLRSRALAAINLGHTTAARRYGLAFDGQVSLDLRRSYATVVLSPGEPPRVVPPGQLPELGAKDEAVQLPLLADEGELLPAARDRGPLRQRSALCVTASGGVLVGVVRHDSSDPVVTALVEAGCSRVVGLDRGSRHPAFIHRAGTNTPPLSEYETSVLYALGRPMIPSAFRWKPPGSHKSVTPTHYDREP